MNCAERINVGPGKTEQSFQGENYLLYNNKSKISAFYVGISGARLQRNRSSPVREREIGGKLTAQTKTVWFKDTHT